jgi:hypothetical protein
MQTIPVLYIAGAGRSGSTLLELILGSLPEMFSVGEVRFLLEYLVQGDRICGCGQRLNDCSFWRSTQIKSSLSSLQLTQLALMAKDYDRTRNLLWLTQNFPAHRQPPQEFLDATLQLYQSIYKANGHRIIVDSSKVPSHLNILSRINQIDLHVLHLVRDGRAVVYSWSKRQKKELGSIHKHIKMSSPAALKSIAVWGVENYFTRVVGTKTAKYTSLRYEDFVRDPALVLQTALDQLSLGVDLSTLSWPEITVDATHSVGGNPIRFGQKKLKLKADTEWVDKMTIFEKVGLGILAWPILRQFDYSLL